MNKLHLISINIIIWFLKAVTGLSMYASGILIYIAGGIIALVAIACCFFGFVKGDGVKHIAIGSMILLVILAGASGASTVLIRLLEGLRRRMTDR